MTTTTTVRIVLADDHQVVRDGLRALLDAEHDFEVVGEVGDGLEVAPLVTRLKPNVLVLDLLMPGLSGLEVARDVTRRAPDTRIVVLSMHASEAHVLQALKNGATAYVLKDAGAAQLVKAIREAVAGRRYLSPPFADRAKPMAVPRQCRPEPPVRSRHAWPVSWSTRPRCARSG